MGENENERLIRLETQFELMFKALNSSIERLEKKLEAREEAYVTREILDEKLRHQQTLIDGLQQGLNGVRDSKDKSRSLWVCNAPQSQDMIFRKISYVLLPLIRMRFARFRERRTE